MNGIVANVGAEELTTIAKYLKQLNKQMKQYNKWYKAKYGR